MTLCDGPATVEIIGRCDDGADDSLVSPKLAQHGACQGIGKLTAIQPVKFQVAITHVSEDEGESKWFTFSRTWTMPRTVLHLSAGKLELRHISFLVAYEDLRCEELLIGLLVFQLLRVDTRTVLEQQLLQLADADCSEINPLPPQ